MDNSRLPRARVRGMFTVRRLRGRWRRRLTSLAALRAEHENPPRRGVSAARRDTKVSRKVTKDLAHPRTEEKALAASVKLMVRSWQAVLS